VNPIPKKFGWTTTAAPFESPLFFCSNGFRFVSLTKERPHIPVGDARDLPAYPENGYLLGMSNPAENYSLTLVSPESIRGWK
jgi:hypothetical protein